MKDLVKAVDMLKDEVSGFSEYKKGVSETDNEQLKKIMTLAMNQELEHIKHLINFITAAINTKM